MAIVPEIGTARVVTVEVLKCQVNLVMKMDELTWKISTW